MVTPRQPVTEALTLTGRDKERQELQRREERALRALRRCEEARQAEHERVLALEKAATAIVEAHELLRNAINGQGHEGIPHDEILWPGPTEDGYEIHSTSTDCAACGGAAYGAEDHLNNVLAGLRLTLGLPLRLFEDETSARATLAQQDTALTSTKDTTR